MNWIKCSDRLPVEQDAEYISRNLRTGRKEISWFKFLERNKDHYEWLDESQPSPSLEQEAKEYENNLVKIIEGFSDFYHNYKNIEPEKSITTIIQEYVRSLDAGCNHTQEEVIGFAEWIGENGFSQWSKSKWRKEGEWFTTAQLYNEYRKVCGLPTIDTLRVQQAKELHYWKELSEAADEVIKRLPDRKENLYELGFHQAIKKYEEIKQQGK